MFARHGRNLPARAGCTSIATRLGALVEAKGITRRS
jgi:hypothetical protein